MSEVEGLVGEGDTDADLALVAVALEVVVGAVEDIACVVRVRKLMGDAVEPCEAEVLSIEPDLHTFPRRGAESFMVDIDLVQASAICLSLSLKSLQRAEGMVSKDEGFQLCSCIEIGGER